MRTVKTSAVLAAAFAGLFVGTASAQEAVIAQVPFAFVVRGEVLPAGRYEVRNDSGILTIWGTDNASRVLAMTRQADGVDPAGDKPALVFIRNEGVNRLSQIWESTDGLALPEPSKAPRHAEAQPSDALIVVLAANRK